MSKAHPPGRTRSFNDIATINTTANAENKAGCLSSSFLINRRGPLFVCKCYLAKARVAGIIISPPWKVEYCYLGSSTCDVFLNIMYLGLPMVRWLNHLASRAFISHRVPWPHTFMVAIPFPDVRLQFPRSKLNDPWVHLDRRMSLFSSLPRTNWAE